MLQARPAIGDHQGALVKETGPVVGIGEPVHEVLEQTAHVLHIPGETRISPSVASILRSRSSLPSLSGQ